GPSVWDCSTNPVEATIASAITKNRENRRIKYLLSFAGCSILVSRLAGSIHPAVFSGDKGR
ncbi:MAG TPA: hypothetical protein VN774_00455, partial [Candidatus Limnocylindrales bacterium]|nr:hypothetical protein [Candidatus Limnocylindrales bacterium]